MLEVLRLRAKLCCVLVVSLLAIVLQPSDIDALQPVPPLITEEMHRQIDEQGSVVLSVTYRSTTQTPDGSPATFQADALPAERGLNGTPGLGVLAVLDSLHSAEVVVTTNDVLVALANDPDVLSMVIPPYEGTFSQVAGPDLRGAQRAMAVESAQMHNRGHLGAGVTVAIVDTGIDNAHPDLTTSISFEACVQTFSSGRCPDGTVFQTGAGAAAAGSSHGTQMASAVTSDGTTTPLGVAPGASIEAVRISTTTAVDLRNALIALDFIAANRPETDIVMLSFGSELTFEASCSRDLWPAFYDAVRTLRERGVFVTASTGNAGIATRQTFPACLDDVYAVTALNVEGTATASTANVAASTDLAAPGSGVAVHETASLSGTSIANAFVAGCAALAVHSGYETPAEIEQWLKHPTRSVATPNGGASTMQCAPHCMGRPVSVNLGLGEGPTDQSDVILGTSGTDVIVAGLGDDMVCAESGDDVVFAGQGDDVVAGGDGADRLWGNFGNDVLFGGGGADTLHGGAGSDDLRGQLGDDRIYGYSGPDVLSGGQGNDRLHGNADGDVLMGDPGDDRMYGYGGDDELDGGIGNDTCRGNAGNDAVARCETAS